VVSPGVTVPSTTLPEVPVGAGVAAGSAVALLQPAKVTAKIPSKIVIIYFLIRQFLSNVHLPPSILHYFPFLKKVIEFREVIGYN
jgi:hypothetical protein